MYAQRLLHFYKIDGKICLILNKKLVYKRIKDCSYLDSRITALDGEGIGGDSPLS